MCCCSRMRSRMFKMYLTFPKSSGETVNINGRHFSASATSEVRRINIPRHSVKSCRAISVVGRACGR